LLTGLGSLLWKWREAEQARAEADRARQLAEEQSERRRRTLERLNAAHDLVESAEVHAHAARWAAAEADYTRAVNLRPDHYHVWSARGEFYATLGLWGPADADFGRAFAIQRPAISLPWYRHALLRLYNGDRDGYRAVCARMRRHFAGTDDRLCACEVARTCALDAEPADAAALVRLAERGLDGGPWRLYGAGPAPHRAGQHEQAVPHRPT